MSEPSPEPLTETKSEIPMAVVRPRRLSWTWLVPILALGVVGVLLFGQVMRDRGEMIRIEFKDASGLEPGSEIIHRGVHVGVVRAVTLSQEMDGVIVDAELTPAAERLAVAGTKFWMVRPQVSLQRIAGLETLIGPRYIELRPGSKGQAKQTNFVALEGPPTSELPIDGSLRIILKASRLGSIAPGNPVLYREIKVGTVRAAQLTNDGSAVLISIDIEPHYAPLVHEKTRFWRSGGVGVDFGIFSGLSVQADSLEAAMSSSVSLATPEKKMGDRAKAGDLFELADGVDGDWLKWSPKIELGG